MIEEGYEDAKLYKKADKMLLLVEWLLLVGTNPQLVEPDADAEYL